MGKRDLSQPHEDRLRIRLMGPMQVAPPHHDWIRPRTNNVERLFAYLWVHRGETVAREQVAGLLWPDSDEKRARQNLRNTVYYLRKALNSTDAEDPDDLFFEVTHKSLKLQKNSDAWVDADAFESTIEDVKGRPLQHQADMLEQAVQLYDQGFLPNCYEDWASVERGRLRALYFEALEGLIGHHFRSSAFDDSIRNAQRLLTEDPLREDVHRQLIALYYLKGDRSKALHQFRTCLRALETELGVNPDPQTTTIGKLIEESASERQVAQAAALSESERHVDLPTPLTSFVGRQSELDQLRHLLQQFRVITLTGLGGSGKTRLALELARQVADEYEDGVRWISLENVQEPSMTAYSLASTLGIQQTHFQSPEAILVEYLKERALLLVFDNAEHVAGEITQLAEHILKETPHTNLLITSQEPLRVEGGVSWQVPQLSYPKLNDRQAMDDPQAHDAIQLLLDRIRTVRPEFRLDPENVNDVIEICAQLEGSPLAIEIATAQLDSLSLSEVRHRMNDRFRLTMERPNARKPRHHTLWAVLEGGYEALSTRERLLLRRFAVFSGPVSLDTIESLCADDHLPKDDILGLLRRLIAKCWIQMDDKCDGWYRMLGTVKQYMWTKLEEADDPQPLRDRHLRRYVSLVEEAEDQLKGSGQERWLVRLENEYENVRAAFRWAIVSGSSELGMRLIGAFWRFWDIHGYFSEGRKWIAQALSELASTDSNSLGKVLNAAGVLALRQSDYAQAQRRLEESLRWHRDRDEHRGMAMAQNNLGLLLRSLGNYADALRHHQESLTIRRETGSPWEIAMTLINLGNAHFAQTEYDDAERCLQESLSILRGIKDDWGIAIALSYLGMTAFAQGHVPGAEEYFQESLQLRQDLNDRHGIAGSLVNLGNLAVCEAKTNASQEHLKCGLSIFIDLADKEGIADAFDAWARCLMADDEYREATMLFGKVESLREEIGSPNVSLWTRAVFDHEAHWEELRGKLGDEEFRHAWQRGRTLSLDQAIDLTRKDETE